ncbi:MAP kinase Spk1 [Orobanche minor]
MENANGSASGLRFQRIPRQYLSNCFQMDPLLDENLERWPHLNELLQGYGADWVKDDCKYGHYESVGPITFHNQIFEGPDTDIETELELANARRTKVQDLTEEEIASTSGVHYSGSNFYDSSKSETSKHGHFGESPLPAYEPVFDWDNERSTIFGHRIPAANIFQYTSGLRIAVKVLSLSFQAGFVEPFYGTICLYNRERKEKLSEDFIFHMLPAEVQDSSSCADARGIFRVDVPSASVCLLIQLEKPATEEGGVTSSVYSRKEPVHLTEREKQKLQVWSRIMPYREPFAWAIIPLFDSGVTSASGGSASPSSPLITSISGSTQESTAEPVAKITMDGKLEYSGGNSVVVEVSNLSKVKEGYMEESLLDPKRKIHKPVKGILRLEIEKLQSGLVDSERSFENRSTNSDLACHHNSWDTAFTKSPSYRTDGQQNTSFGSHSSDQNGSLSHGLVDSPTAEVSTSVLPIQDDRDKGFIHEQPKDQYKSSN